MFTKKQKVINYVLLICIFGVGVVLHYFYGTFSKSIDVLPDEIRYYSIARSIFQGDGLTFRGVATDYQKMGYTLFLVPFFLIKNGILRMKAITLANSCLMMSSIFPIYGIMNKLDISNRVKLLFLTVFIVFPDLMYSATFMAEVLYWPILLVFIYLWMVNRERCSYVLSIILGVICYIGYSTKEIFLAVLLSVILFELLFPTIEHFVFNRNNGKKIKTYYESKRIIQMILLVAAFAIVYLIIKLIFFWGLGNSYDQMGIEAIASPKKFGYMIYGFMYYIAAIFVACFLLPLILPAMQYSQLKDRVRETYIYNTLCLVMAIATVAYTITVREDYGDLIPRLHFRYIGPFVILAIIIFIKTLDYVKNDFKLKKSHIITIVITMLFTFGLFRGVTVITGVDQFTLDWVVLITDHLGDVWGQLLVFALIVIVVVLTMILLSHKRHNIVVILTMAFMLALGIINSITAKERLVEYMYRDENLVQETLELNDFLSGIEGGVLYVGEANQYSDSCKCVDTFVDRNSKMYYVSREGLSNLEDGIHSVSDISIPMQLNLWKMKHDNIESIEYIVENVTNTENYNVEVTNITPVEEIGGTYYKVYKNNDSASLSIKK